ncbi:MAG: hypothetical protein KIT10_05590 [Flavobacteriales bacterium]|nr:hypothetical protein [Flavobacteriales bacterium]
MRLPILLLIFALCAPALLRAQNVGVNADGAAPAPSAMLDVDVTALPAANKRGLLVPRIALTAANVAAPVVAPANSLLIFNTATAGVAPNAVTPGYYYWDAPLARWIRFASDGDNWRLTGNAGTTPATQFLGTTDNVAFRIRTNNIERIMVEAAGQVGVNGVPVAPAQLDVQSTNRGVRIPQIGLTSGAASNIPIGAGVVNSLLVFNTATAGAAPNAVTPGYYYWDTPSARWRRLLNDADVGPAWQLLGNAGTVAATNFLGTTDNIALRLRTNNLERFELATTGELRSFGNGTAIAPAYSWTTNTNMGMFRQNTNVLGFSTTSVERLRIMANGQVVAPGVAPMFAGDLLSGVGFGALPYGVVGTSGPVAGTSGVWGEAFPSAAIGAHGVFGLAYMGSAAGGLLNGIPVYALHAGATGTGVFSIGNNVAALTYLPAGSGGTFNGFGVGSFGVAQGAAGFGVYGVGNSAANGTGVLGIGNATVATVLPTGGGGQFFGTAVGAYARATTLASGTGVTGMGNNLAVAAPATGAGGFFAGNAIGAYGRAQTVATGIGVIGTGNNNALFTLGTGAGGAFSGTSVGAFGAATTGATPTGVVGVGNNLGVFTLWGGGSGGAFNGTAVGAYGLGTAALNGTGVVGAGNNIAPAATVTMVDGSGGAFTGTLVGALGVATNALGTGLDGRALGVDGIGVVGEALPVNGWGVLGLGEWLGSFSIATSVADGVGAVGAGNGVPTAFIPVQGSGVAGTGTRMGVYGFATNTNTGVAGTVERTGGYFASGPDAAPDVFAYVAAVDNVPRKIEGVGTVNTIIEDVQGRKVLMSAPEAPENLFQDYGTGQLVNGRAVIALDPSYSKNILVNDQHPLRVFVQLRGDCNGVYVTNETADGFEVVELMGGSSNAKFYWTVTANRANVISPSGAPWNYAEERFSPAMSPAAMTTQELQTRGPSASERVKERMKSLTTGIAGDTTVEIQVLPEQPAPEPIEGIQEIINTETVPTDQIDPRKQRESMGKGDESAPRD